MPNLVFKNLLVRSFSMDFLEFTWEISDTMLDPEHIKQAAAVFTGRQMAEIEKSAFLLEGGLGAGTARKKKKAAS